MKRFSLYALLSSLLLFVSCKEDSDVTANKAIALDLIAINIDQVSDPAADGSRTIDLTFTDKGGAKLTMTSKTPLMHFEAGWYTVNNGEAAKRNVNIALSVEGNDVAIESGSVFVKKHNYEYSFRFELTTADGSVSGAILNHRLYFETAKYSSLSTGANEIYLRDQTIQSEILNTQMKYSIYLPESYDGTKKYPVLYILHGYGGNNNDWLQDNTGGLWAGGGTLPAYAREFAAEGGKEMIIVAPDGKNLFYCDGYESGVNYMSYFFEEFLPYIESTYAIKSERSSRAIGGLSMGGYGSLYYGLLHPEMFCHVYACSAAISVGGNAPDLVQFVSHYSTQGTLKNLPEFTLEMGTEDSLYPNNNEFIKTLDTYNVPYEYITRKGAHDWKFWNACSPKIIRKSAAVFE